MAVAAIMMVLEYDGAGFHGWQRQSDVRTVQGELERVLSMVLGESVTLTGAGRTDAGCHAAHQVASFSTDSAVALPRIARSVNGLLRGEVVVREIAVAPEGFNARFSAVSRTYRYLVARRATALFRGRAWTVEGAFDETAMNEAAAALTGVWNFSGFAKIDKDAGRSPVCAVHRAGWAEWDLGLAFEIEGDRFLQGMVRTIVGTMVRIGTGRVPPGCVKQILEGEGTLRGGPCAPAKGLCLVNVSYGPACDEVPGATISGRRQRNEVLPGYRKRRSDPAGRRHGGAGRGDDQSLSDVQGEGDLP
jgi:tRNA pseudouridine38-40 synthase